MHIACHETKLTDTEATGFYGQAASVDDEYSLVALFRAIVINHEDCSDIEAIEQKSRIGLFQASIQNDIDDVEKIVKETPISLVTCRDSFEVHGEGWETFDSQPYYLNRYLSQVTKSKVYINKAERRVIALIDRRIKQEWLQAFCSMLWVILPWYYPTKDEDTIAFFKSISLNNSKVTDDEAKQNLIRYVNEAANKIDIHNLFTHKMLDGLADEAKNQRLTEHRQNVANLEDFIRKINQQLMSQYEQLGGELAIVKGLESLEAKSNNELFEFFDQHKNVNVISRRGTQLTYGVVDTLEFYDEDEAKALFENQKSWVYSFAPELVTPLASIFLEKRGIFKINAQFRLTNMALVSPVVGHLVEGGGMPNPHIYNYGCSGANDKYYSQYANEGAWDLAIEQSISATKNWSVGDSTVGTRMFEWIAEHGNVPCVYVTDGSPLTEVTPDCKLVSFDEYKDIVSKKIENEVKNNG